MEFDTQGTFKLEETEFGIVYRSRGAEDRGLTLDHLVQRTPLAIYNHMGGLWTDLDKSKQQKVPPALLWIEGTGKDYHYVKTKTIEDALRFLGERHPNEEFKHLEPQKY